MLYVLCIVVGVGRSTQMQCLEGYPYNTQEHCVEISKSTGYKGRGNKSFCVGVEEYNYEPEE